MGQGVAGSRHAGQGGASSCSFREPNSANNEDKLRGGLFFPPSLQTRTGPTYILISALRCTEQGARAVHTPQA